MTDEQVNKIVNSLNNLTQILEEIRDIQKSWDEEEPDPDFDNTDKYIL